MNLIIAVTGVSLLVIIGWMAALSARKKKLAVEKKERERAYRKAIEKQHDQEKQERLFKAETGHVPTQLFLAKEAEMSNPREALYWYERAAMLDSEMAMYGVVRVCGRAKEDIILKEKSRFWQMAIEAYNGSQKAKFEMGKAFIAGSGVETNLEKGLQAIEDVANEGSSEAQVFMGDWYIAESNMSPNPKLSSEWYFRAAQQNNTDGQVKLGLNYYNGVGVKKSIKRATYWFEAAGERGSAEGQYYAGDIWMGQGTNGNAIAYLWLYLSAHFGYDDARSKRDDLGNILGVEGVVGMQSMAKPLTNKLASGPLSKHSLIIALDKLYKRESYFPERDGNEFMLGSATQEDTDETEKKGDNGDSLDFSITDIDK